MKKVLIFAAAVCAALLTGCAREVIVAEVLQLPEQASIHTAYNLWYDDPQEMTTANIQKGKIIPFGTTVEITSASERYIEFRTPADGQEYRIVFSEWFRLGGRGSLLDKNRMMTLEEFIRITFTGKTEDELRAGIDPATYEKIRRGIVSRKMSREAVLLAYGPPCANRTPSLELSTWLYPVDFIEYKRIIFLKNQVMDIIHP